MRSVYIALPESALDRLAELARREMRDPKAQASWLILDGLRRAGLDAGRPDKRSVVPSRPTDR